MNILHLRTKVLKRCKRIFDTHRPIENRTVGEPLVVYYRISDAGYPKTKPSYINNENCLRNVVKEFPVGDQNRWVLIADNCSDTTIEMIKKYVPEECINKQSVGHGAGTFLMTFKMALELPDTTPVYFLENDYLHRPCSRQALMDGLALAPYVTLYDHPNKYVDGNGAKFWGSKTEVVAGAVCHWKNAHSTTMTFASTAGVIKKDRKIFERWLTTRHPYDYEIFLDLNRKGRRLISPVPSFSTHGETEFLAPFIDWKKIENAL